MGEIWRVGDGSSQPLLGAASAHLLAVPGKRLRSSLLLEVAGLGPRADMPLARRAAAAVEILHLASLAHDDVIDDSELRRGTATVSSRFGCLPAAYVGGWLFARALESAADCGDTVIDLLATAVAQLCDGEMLELEDVYNAARPTERYLSAIEGKTAVLYGLAARLGGELGGLGAAECADLEQAGTQLGMAFQIADDLLDLLAAPEETGKPRGSDLRHGVYTLPVLYAAQESAALRDRLLARVREEQLPEVVDLVMATAGIGRALEDLQRYVRWAKAGIAGVFGDRAETVTRVVDRAIAPVWKDA